MGKIVIVKRCGRLANRLVLYANIIAWAEENCCSVINYSFQSYAKFFSSTKYSTKSSYPPKKENWFSILVYPLVAFFNFFRIQHQIIYFFSKVILRSQFLQRIFPMISDKNFNEVQRLDALGISRLLEENRFVYLSGWQFREPQLTLKHREKLLIFSLCNNHFKTVSVM